MRRKKTLLSTWCSLCISHSVTLWVRQISKIASSLSSSLSPSLSQWVVIRARELEKRYNKTSNQALIIQLTEHLASIICFLFLLSFGFCQKISPPLILDTRIQLKWERERVNEYQWTEVLLTYTCYNWSYSCLSIWFPLISLLLACSFRLLQKLLLGTYVDGYEQLTSSGREGEMMHTHTHK